MEKGIRRFISKEKFQSGPEKSMPSSRRCSSKREKKIRGKKVRTEKDNNGVRWRIVPKVKNRKEETMIIKGKVKTKKFSSAWQCEGSLETKKKKCEKPKEIIFLETELFAASHFNLRL